MADEKKDKVLSSGYDLDFEDDEEEEVTKKSGGTSQSDLDDLDDIEEAKKGSAKVIANDAREGQGISAWQTLSSLKKCKRGLHPSLSTDLIDDKIITKCVLCTTVVSSTPAQSCDATNPRVAEKIKVAMAKAQTLLSDVYTDLAGAKYMTARLWRKLTRHFKRMIKNGKSKADVAAYLEFLGIDPKVYATFQEAYTKNTLPEKPAVRPAKTTK